MFQVKIGVRRPPPQTAAADEQTVLPQTSETLIADTLRPGQTTGCVHHNLRSAHPRFIFIVIVISGEIRALTGNLVSPTTARNILPSAVSSKGAKTTTLRYKGPLRGD